MQNYKITFSAASAVHLVLFYLIFEGGSFLKGKALLLSKLCFLLEETPFSHLIKNLL